MTYRSDIDRYAAQLRSRAAELAASTPPAWVPGPRWAPTWHLRGTGQSRRIRAASRTGAGRGRG